MSIRGVFTVSTVSGLLMLGSACSGENEKPSVGASASAGSETLVGYDLRRLRPREETLKTTFDRAQRRAHSDGKRIAVLFSADWCEPCRAIDVELGNRHPPGLIGDVRILELKEEDWKDAARMDEFNALRTRFYPVLGSYPVFVLLDRDGKVAEEMKDGVERLEAEGLDPSLPIWFESTKP